VSGQGLSERAAPVLPDLHVRKMFVWSAAGFKLDKREILS